MYENTFPNKRFRQTLSFLQKHIPTEYPVLDLGVPNPFSKMMVENGYLVENTKGEDLDVDFSTVRASRAEVVTAFEIFEHLLAPFNVLREIKADHLVASVPLRLWFAKAYRSKTDPWDRHYHEFEDWQFNWLLDKAGWEVIATEKFSNPVKKLGLRPLLRSFTPRYYLVLAKRKTQSKSTAAQEERMTMSFETPD